SYLAKYREANARDSLSLAPGEARVISRAIMSSTPSFPKKVPIIVIATMATFLLSLAFITTGELLAGNVYRERDVVIFDEVEARPVASPARPAAAALHSAFAGRSSMDRSIMPAESPADEEAAVATEPVPTSRAPAVAATAKESHVRAEVSS